MASPCSIIKQDQDPDTVKELGLDFWSANKIKEHCTDRKALRTFEMVKTHAVSSLHVERTLKWVEGNTPLIDNLIASLFPEDPLWCAECRLLCSGLV